MITRQAPTARTGSPNPPVPHVAFLRGINVGGRAVVGMAGLKRVFEGLGFKNVRTVLASGNVVFETARTDRNALRDEIEARLKRVFKRDIGVLLRRREEMERLRSTEPFRRAAAGPDIQRYVTFLPEAAAPRSITPPCASPGGEFRILRATRSEVFSVVDLSRGKGTPQAMAFLEKEFGSRVTTRNWNTILKILA